MNSVSLFFFHLCLSISDGFTKCYRMISRLFEDFAALCLQKSLKNDDSVEVLDYQKIRSRRIFVSENM